MRNLTRISWPVAAGILLIAASFARAAVDPDVLMKVAFDNESKSYDAKITDTNAPFAFYLTNLWTNEITIDRVQTSCGCTVATLPANPWHIPAGGHGEVTASVNLHGKAPGLLQKTITFFVSARGEFLGTRVVTVMVNVPKAPPPQALTEAQRKAAMEQAKADPQLIFKDPKCAECHVQQGAHAWGAELYAADCGICHDSPNRASWVPDLHKLKVPTGFVYWREIITHGKPHTMMPAFAQTDGGPLSDDQIHTLAQYLNRTFTSAPPP